jgi:hypothetical protein
LASLWWKCKTVEWRTTHPGLVSGRERKTVQQNASFKYSHVSLVEVTGMWMAAITLPFSWYFLDKLFLGSTPWVYPPRPYMYTAYPCGHKTRKSSAKM